MNEKEEARGGTPGLVGLRSNDNSSNPTLISPLRKALAELRARYDSGAVAPGMYAVIRQMETEIAWEEYKQ